MVGMIGRNKLFARIIAIGICFSMVVSAIPFLFSDSDEENITASISSVEPYTFLVPSDGHWGYATNPTGSRTVECINQLGNQTDVSRIFDNGDLASDGGVLQATYDSIKVLYDALGIPYNVTCGNHDSDTFMKNTWGIATTYIMDTVVDGDLVWIYLQANIVDVEMHADQLTYLETQLETYSNNLCFVILHINHQRVVSNTLEIDSDRFGLILANNSDHIGGVIGGHIHDPDVTLWPYYDCGKARTYYQNDIYYTYPGTYGSGYNAMNPNFRYTFLVVKVYDYDTYHTIQCWRKNVSTNATIDGTFFSMTFQSNHHQVILMLT